MIVIHLVPEEDVTVAAVGDTPTRERVWEGSEEEVAAAKGGGNIVIGEAQGDEEGAGGAV
jgi:hypothetical protein